MIRKPFLFFLVLVFLSVSAHADQFTVKSGKTYEGEILDESKTDFILETKQGIINLQKAKIETRNGEPYTGAPPAAVVLVPASAVSDGRSVYAVQVGSEGLTEQELAVYQSGHNKLERHQHLSGLDWGTNDINIRAAIEDEIVFQEALKAGVHQRGDVRDQMIQMYRAEQTLQGIEPSKFGDEEMRVFYESHKKEFLFPAEYAFKVLQVSPSGSGRDAAQKAKASPASVDGWKGGAKMKEGDSFYLPLGPSQEKTIFALRQNQVSDLIIDSLGMGNVFWCTSYQAPRQKTFEEARERVKHLMIQSKQSSNEAQLQQSLQVSGQASDAALFDAALRAGVHRQRNIRSLIINLYLQQRGAGLGAIVNEAKDKYQVTLNG